MESEPDPKLETLLHRELQDLPPIKAPSGLAPNVMAILAARARVRIPWWHRAWWDWPVAARAAFALFAIAVAGAMGGGGFVLGDGAASFSTNMMEEWNPADGVLGNFMPLWDAGVLVWQHLAQPFLLYGVVLAAAVYAMFIGVGTACFRFAWKRI